MPRPPTFPGRILAASLLVFALWVGACSKKLKTGTAKLAPDAPSVIQQSGASRPGWSGYLGSNRDGRSAEEFTNTDWASKEPELAWKASIGKGATGIVVAEGRAYAFGNENEQDTVRCLDAKTGDELWSISYSCPLDNRQFEGGPAATPELDSANGRLYVLSHQGELRCLATSDGAEIWSSNVSNEHGGSRPKWGYAGSPLLVDDLLVVEIGGKNGVLALDAATGEKKWSSANGDGGSGAGYGAPIAYEQSGKRGVAVFTAAGLEGFDLADGGYLFDHEWETSYDVNASTPVYHAGHFFICSGYGKGGGLISVTGEKAQLVYETRDAVSQFQTPIRIGEHLYLVTGDNSSRSRLNCLRFDNGELAWSEPLGGNRGNVIALGDKLIAISERGEAMLCEASPAGYNELGRFQASSGRVWAPPAYSGGQLYVRNNDGGLRVWNLR